MTISAIYLPLKPLYTKEDAHFSISFTLLRVRGVRVRSGPVLFLGLGFPTLVLGLGWCSKIL